MTESQHQRLPPGGSLWNVTEPKLPGGSLVRAALLPPLSFTPVAPLRFHRGQPHFFAANANVRSCKIRETDKKQTPEEPICSEF